MECPKCKNENIEEFKEEVDIGVGTQIYKDYFCRNCGWNLEHEINSVIIDKKSRPHGHKALRLKNGKLKTFDPYPTATDCIKVTEFEWDNANAIMRSPYQEITRKNGYVYAIRTKEE